MDFGPLAELVEALGVQGFGVTIRPFAKGSPLSGIGTQHYYEFDGWEVGFIAHWGGDELAVGETIADAVRAALETVREDGI